MNFVRRFYRDRLQQLRPVYSGHMRDQRNEIAALKAEIVALRARLRFVGDNPEHVERAVQQSRSEAAKARERWGVA
jgi:hypothetical protein